MSDGGGTGEATDGGASGEAAPDADDAASDVEEAASDADTVAVDLDALDRPVVLFDGVCNLCNGFVRFVVRRDSAGTFRFAALQSPVGQALLDRHGFGGEDFDTMVLVEPDGTVSTKSTAALGILRRLDRPWSLLGPFRVLPEPLCDAVYDLVATYRYRVFGKRDDVCEVPEPELRERFAERTLE